MNCSKADEYFMKYMDGALTKDEAQKLNKHLLVCEKCRTDFYVYDSLVKEFSSCELIEAPADLEERVMAEISAISPAHLMADKTANTLLTGGLFAILSLLFAGVMLFINRDAALELMSGYSALSPYVDLLKPVSLFVTDLSANTQAVVTDFIGQAAVFLNGAKYIILLAALSLFALQYFLYKKEKDKVEE